MPILWQLNKWFQILHAARLKHLKWLFATAPAVLNPIMKRMNCNDLLFCLIKKPAIHKKQLDNALCLRFSPRLIKKNIPDKNITDKNITAIRLQFVISQIQGVFFVVPDFFFFNNLDKPQ